MEICTRRQYGDVQAYEIEEGASRLLQQLSAQQTSEGGIVHSVYRSTVNIWWPNNEWLVIGANRSILMPNMIRVREQIDFTIFPKFIKSGNRIEFIGNQLYMDGQAWCSLNASKCSALSIKAVEQLDYERPLALLNHLIRACGRPGGAMLPWLALVEETLPQASSLASPQISPPASPQASSLSPQPAWPMEQPLTLHERQLYEALQQLTASSTAQGSEGQLYEEAGRLVGMGIGLTPSGDDFLTGLFTILIAADARHRQWVASERKFWLSRARGRTTFVAYEMLRQVLSGKVNRALWLLVQALDARTGASTAQVQHHIQQLLAIGSTSGTDMAAGLAFGLTYLHRKRA